MSSRSFLLFGSVLVSIAIGYFLHASKQVETAVDDEVYERLQHLVSNVEAVDNAILRVHNNLVLHFDEITAHQRLLHEDLAALKKLRATAIVPWKGTMATFVEKFELQLNDHSFLLDRYKVSKAVLRNSINYFPTATSNLLATVPDRDRRIKLIDSLQTSVFGYVVSGGSQWRDEYMVAEKKLAGLTLDDAAARDARKNLLDHTRVVIDNAGVVADLVRDLSQHSAKALVQQTLKDYLLLAGQSQRISERYQNAAYGASVTLVVIVFFWFMLTVRAATTRERENYFRSLIENSSDLITIVHPDGKIRYQSPSIERVLGMPSDQWEGRNVFDLVMPRERTDLRTALGKINSCEGVMLPAFTVRDHNGRWRSLEAMAGRTKQSGRIEFVLNMRDVTDRIEAQSKIKRALREAIKSNRTKNDFLGKMSHELNTPLNAIIGYSEIVRERARASSRADEESDAERIFVAADHLLTMINEMLDHSQIESGKMTAELSEFALGPFVDDLAKIAEPIAQRQNNRFHVSSNCPDKTIVSDVTKVRKIILGLISNASKFTESGTVKLAVDCECGESRDWIKFSIADTGIGISPEDQEKLFQPFVQLSKKQGVFYGTGLGLSNCKQLCDLLGGQMSVNSELGKGSTFQFYLPVEHRYRSRRRVEVSTI